MRLFAACLALALTAEANSPHVYQPVTVTDRLPSLNIESKSHVVGSLDNNGSMHINNLLGRQGTDGDPNAATPPQQQGRVPPLFPLPGCMFCPKNDGTGYDLLKEFTVDRFILSIRALKADLKDTCIFYTRPETQGNYALSRPATQIACDYGKYSIWNLWPNSANVKNADYPDQYFNFYGIADVNSPLYKIWQLPTPPFGKPPRIEYFENMSRAMARQCSGDIFILTDTPFNIAQYFRMLDDPNTRTIFASTEHPELFFKRDDTAKWIVIDNQSGGRAVKQQAYRVTDKVYVSTNSDQSVGTNWKRGGNATHPDAIPRGYEPYDLDLELKRFTPEQMKKRLSITCDSGVADEPAGEDFFG